MLQHKFIKFFLALIIIGQACIYGQVLAKVYIPKGQKGCILRDVDFLGHSDLGALPGQKIRVSWQDESLYNTHHSWRWGIVDENKQIINNTLRPIGQSSIIRRAGRLGVISQLEADRHLYFKVESLGRDWYYTLTSSVYVLLFIPHILFIVGLFAYLLNPKNDRRGKGYFSAMIVFEILGWIFTFVNLFIPWTPHEGISPIIANGMIGMVVLGLPSLIVFFKNLGGFINLYLHFRYAFRRKPIENIRQRKKEIEMRKERERDYQNKVRENKKNIEEKERRLVKIHRENPEIANEVPETLEYLSDNLQYRGYFGEAGRRFQDRQIARSIKVRTETITETKNLVNELSELRRSQAALQKSFYESEAEERKLKIKRQRMEQGEIEEQAELEMDIERLTLEKEKAELETQIESNRVKRELEKGKLGSETESKTKGLSPAERERQSMQNKLEMLKARVANAVEADKAVKEILDGIENEETKERIKRILDDFKMELME